MKKKSLVIFLLICCVGGYSQISWPVITQTAKPWTRWWWEGSAVDKKNLSVVMQEYKAAGLGGLEITPIYGVKGYEDRFIPFLSADWMNMLQYTLAEAKKLNLGIDLANATGWPFGGPWVSAEDASRNAQVKTYSLDGGRQLNEPIRFTQQPFYRSESRMQVDMKTLKFPVTSNPNLQLFAFDQVRYETELKPGVVIAYGNNGETIDLTNRVDAAGKLNWTAPSGNWKIYALFTGWHGKMVERAAPGGEGMVIDHFNKTALDHYLQRFDKAFAGKDLSGIRSFFNDSYEVDDARGQSNWTPALMQEFKLRRGYDLSPYLPLLFGRDSSDKGRRVLSDYRQTISDLVLHYFTIPWQQWAAGKKKMVRNQSHGSPANIFDLYSVIDIPETEGTDILRFKFATSAANITGKKLASAESATWLNEHFQSSWGDVKQAVDKYFAGGVNHVFWHGTNYSPKEDPWPGWLFYAAVHFTPANPLWKDFSTLNNYVARCQSFLQQGKPDNDVLLYFPFNDRNAEMGRDLLHHFDGMAGFEGTAFKNNAEDLLKKGYAFDIISDKQVQALQAKDGYLYSAGGRYRTIIVSRVQYMPIETLRKLKLVAEQGVPVVFYDELPRSVPGLSGLDKKEKELRSIYASLRFENRTSSIRRASLGKAAFFVGNDLDALLNEVHIKRETFTDKGLLFTRRKNASGHYYFISNPGKTAIDEWVPVSVMDAGIVMFDPMNQNAGKAATRVINGKAEVYLQLQPGGSCILQTSASAVKGNPFPYYSDETNPQVLSGEWKLRFIEGGPVLPASTDLQKPLVWTELAGEAVKNFSGTAEYSIVFPKPSGPASSYRLDLGTVYESAEIIFNGKRLITLLGPSYQVVIPVSRFLYSNELKILVTNGMANRIADLDRRGVPWKKFYNTNFPSRLPQNRGTDGIFTAAKWPVKTAGLGGPVTITALQKREP
jgi:hypothetical protein